MIKVPEHLIEEARKRGIVPGAVIKQFCGGYIGEVFTVGDYEQWSCHQTYWFSVGRAKDLSLFAMANDSWAEVITPAPSQAEGLKEGDAVECGPAMRAAIIELAKELGVPVWREMGNYPAPKYCTYWNSEHERLAPRYSTVEGTVLHTTEAFIAKMRVTAAQPKPIKIGDHTVKFNADKSVTVGCTTVPFTTIETIYNKLKA